MEQKKIQRTIGIVVVVALIVVVTSFFFGKNDFPIQETKNIKAPPIPDQQQSVPHPTASATLPEPPILSSQIETTTVNTPPTDSPKKDATIMTNPTSPSAPSTEPLPQTVQNPQSAPAVGSIIYEPSTISATSTPVSNEQPIQQTTTNTIQPTPIKPVVEKKPIEKPIEKAIHPQRMRVQHATVKRAVHPLKSSAWVIQMGNFAIKKNAIHLVNRLQAAGYKAFIHETRLSLGKNRTRVYIGPELNQASAVQLSHTVNRKLNLQGFVVFYKPDKATT